MSKMRRISASVLARSKKSGSSHGMTWRVGASRPPSRMAYLPLPASCRRAAADRERRGSAEASAPPGSGGEAVERLERPLEPAGMRLLGLGEGLEPVGDLVEALLAGGARHAGVHVGVFVRLAGDRREQVIGGVADRLAGRRVADLLEIFEMAMGVAGLAPRG